MTKERVLSIPEEIVLMLLNEQTGYFYLVEGWTLNCVMAGAALADLSLRSRIDTDEESLILIDSSKTNVPELDICLAEIVKQTEPKDTQYWIEYFSVYSETIIDSSLRRLVDSDILIRHDGGFYSFSSPKLKADEESLNQDIKVRIEEVIFTDNIPNPRDSLIVGLLKACDVLRFIFDLDEERESRIDSICKIELINRRISMGVEQTIITPLQRQTPLSRNLPQVYLRDILKNPHTKDGNLPALFAKFSEKFGPVFELNGPFLKPMTFLVGGDINRWVHRNARMYMTSGNYFRQLEVACGAQNLITSVDGADHFRMRKVMKNVYSIEKFDERIKDVCWLTQKFMTDQGWRKGTEINVKRDTRLLINKQMTNILVDTDTQDIFDELVKWKERASNCYVGHLLPTFFARTPAMKRRFNLLNEFAQRIQQNHTPFQREGATRELADDLYSLHNSDPQFMPEQNLTFMLAAAPVLQSIYVGDLLGFAVYEMAKNPHITEQIRDEANVIFDSNTYGQDQKFSEMSHDVTRRFLMECLRLYPVVSMQVRNVANSCVVENFSLPLGQRIHIVQTAPHYMSKHFPEPYKFDIDRYSEPRNEHKQSAYAPYGLGTHICVGMNWMNLQMMASILLIAYHYEFKPIPKKHHLKINPFPTLSVTEKLKIGIANQIREIPVQKFREITNTQSR